MLTFENITTITLDYYYRPRNVPSLLDGAVTTESEELFDTIWQECEARGIDIVPILEEYLKRHAFWASGTGICGGSEIRVPFATKVGIAP